VALDILGDRVEVGLVTASDSRVLYHLNVARRVCVQGFGSEFAKAFIRRLVKVRDHI
jgi:hypothetical protein